MERILEPDGPVLDLGCGSGDVLLRFARAFPHARFTGVDGSRWMLGLAVAEIAVNSDLARRVRLHRAIIPSADLPREHWQLVMAHSLLHQLHRPAVLWETIRHAATPGGVVVVADLVRAQLDEAGLQALTVETEGKHHQIVWGTT